MTDAMHNRRPLVKDSQKGLEVRVEQPPHVGGLRVAVAVERQGLDARSPGRNCARGGPSRRDRWSSGAVSTVNNLPASMPGRLRGP